MTYRSARCLTLPLIVGALACDIAGPDRSPSRIVMDVRALTGASAALGDGASVVGSVELFVTRNDQTVLSLTRTLTSTDTIAEFDISIDPGDYSFSTGVRSNTQVLLFAGHTTARIPEDFPVVIVPQPTSAVMVVSPRAATVASGQSQNLIVRNVGSRDLLWLVSCTRQVGGSCIQGTPAPIAQPARGNLPPGAFESVLASVVTGSWELIFDSPEGFVTITITR